MTTVRSSSVASSGVVNVAVGGAPKSPSTVTPSLSEPERDVHAVRRGGRLGGVGLGAARAAGEEQGGGGGECDGRGAAQGTVHDGGVSFRSGTRTPSLPGSALDCLRLRIPARSGRQWADGGHDDGTRFRGGVRRRGELVRATRRRALESDLDGGGVALASAGSTNACSTRAAATVHPRCRPPSSWGTAGSSTRSTSPSRWSSCARERAGERMPQLRLHVADVTDVGGRPATTSCSACSASHFFADVEAGHPPADRARPPRRPGRDHGVGARRASSRCPSCSRRAARRAPASTSTGSPGRRSTPPTPPGTLAHWLAELGLVDVRAEAVQRHLDLDARARVAARARHRAPRGGRRPRRRGAGGRARALPGGDRRARRGVRRRDDAHRGGPTARVGRGLSPRRGARGEGIGASASHRTAMRSGGAAAWAPEYFDRHQKHPNHRPCEVSTP